MFSRRTLMACATLAGLLLAVPANAAKTIEYDQADFDAAQKAGKSILIEIHATWCPTCKAQASILDDIEKQPEFKNLLVLHVDFDAQKDVVKRFGGRMQSTLITFKGGKETGISTGDTNPETLAALLHKAV